MDVDYRDVLALLGDKVVENSVLQAQVQNLAAQVEALTKENATLKAAREMETTGKEAPL